MMTQPFIDFSYMVMLFISFRLFHFQEPFYWHEIIFSAWVSNYTRYNVWDEITFPITNLNGEAACDHLFMFGLFYQ